MKTEDPLNVYSVINPALGLKDPLTGSIRERRSLIENETGESKKTDRQKKKKKIDCFQLLGNLHLCLSKAAPAFRKTAARPALLPGSLS